MLEWDQSIALQKSPLHILHRKNSFARRQTKRQQWEPNRKLRSNVSHPHGPTNRFWDLWNIPCLKTVLRVHIKTEYIQLSGNDDDKKAKSGPFTYTLSRFTSNILGNRTPDWRKKRNYQQVQQNREEFIFIRPSILAFESSSTLVP